MGLECTNVRGTSFLYVFPEQVAWVFFRRLLKHPLFVHVSKMPVYDLERP